VICPCGSEKDFSQCCGPIIAQEQKAATAEALMRSRYSAYTLGDIGYIAKTLAPESKKGFDASAAKKWATQAKWKGLKVLKTEQTNANAGTVEFVATYVQNGETIEHHEVAQFRKNEKAEWLFVDGDAHTHKEGESHHHHGAKIQTVVRESAKVGRNDACPCGSGKKYKKCCAAA
jgi:SEC-C motif domain protein